MQVNLDSHLLPFSLINGVIHTILIKRHGRKLIFGLRKSCPYCVL